MKYIKTFKIFEAAEPLDPDTQFILDELTEWDIKYEYDNEYNSSANLKYDTSDKPPFITFVIIAFLDIFFFALIFVSIFIFFLFVDFLDILDNIILYNIKKIFDVIYILFLHRIFYNMCFR